MLQFIKNDFPGAKRGQSVYFCFEDNVKFIELKFDAPQEKPYKGWTIEPHIKPCRVSIALSFTVQLVILEGFNFYKFCNFLSPFAKTKAAIFIHYVDAQWHMPTNL